MMLDPTQAWLRRQEALSNCYEGKKPLLSNELKQYLWEISVCFIGGTCLRKRFLQAVEVIQ